MSTHSDEFMNAVVDHVDVSVVVSLQYC